MRVGSPEHLKATQDVVDAYEGALVLFMAYTRSMSIALLELSPATPISPKKFIAFFGCAFLSFPTAWKWEGAQLHVLDDEDHPLYELHFAPSEGLPVSIQFQDIFALENKPDLFREKGPG